MVIGGSGLGVDAAGVVVKRRDSSFNDNHCRTFVDNSLECSFVGVHPSVEVVGQVEVEISVGAGSGASLFDVGGPVYIRVSREGVDAIVSNGSECVVSPSTSASCIGILAVNTDLC